MTGALVSCTLKLWLHCAVLPQASTAVQVRTMVFSCGHLPGRVFSVKLTFGSGSHASVAVTLAADGTGWSHSIVMLAGQLASTGACVSVTSTQNTNSVALPHASVTVAIHFNNLQQGVLTIKISTMSNTGFGSQLSVIVKSSGPKPLNTPHSTFTVSPSDKPVKIGFLKSI